MLHLFAVPLWMGVASTVCEAPRHAEQAPELGRVAWQRDLDALLGEQGLKAASKPTLVLFQEVPG